MILALSSGCTAATPVASADLETEKGLQYLVVPASVVAFVALLLVVHQYYSYQITQKEPFDVSAAGKRARGYRSLQAYLPDANAAIRSVLGDRHVATKVWNDVTELSGYVPKSSGQIDHAVTTALAVGAAVMTNQTLAEIAAYSAWRHYTKTCSANAARRTMAKIMDTFFNDYRGSGQSGFPQFPNTNRSKVHMKAAQRFENYLKDPNDPCRRQTPSVAPPIDGCSDRNRDECH